MLQACKGFIKSSQVVFFFARLAHLVHVDYSAVLAESTAALRALFAVYGRHSVLGELPRRAQSRQGVGHAPADACIVQIIILVIASAGIKTWNGAGAALDVRRMLRWIRCRFLLHHLRRSRHSM